MFTTKKDKTALSIPKSKAVCGYVIKKRPLGAYLALLERVKDVPEDFAGKCFPGQKPEELLETLTHLNSDGFLALCGQLMVAVPGYAVGLVAELIDVDADRLLWDESVGPPELLEMIDAIIEVNGLGEFWAAAKALTARLQSLTPALTQTPGSGSSG